MIIVIDRGVLKWLWKVFNTFAATDELY